ncbi:MAG: calcium-binding protein, partial [Betaproteobacteria bacterium]|nr:calcium-binding protein [Betaproteobacteria bacterium]
LSGGPGNDLIYAGAGDDEVNKVDSALMVIGDS